MIELQDRMNQTRMKSQIEMLIKDVAEMREVIVGLANQLYALTHPDTDHSNEPR